MAKRKRSRSGRGQPARGRLGFITAAIVLLVALWLFLPNSSPSRPPRRTSTPVAATRQPPTRTPASHPRPTVTPRGNVQSRPTVTTRPTTPPTVSLNQARPTTTPIPGNTTLNPVRYNSTRTYYATGRVSVRSCPSTECAVIETLSSGEAVELLGEIEGAAVSGERTWYLVRRNNQDAYVHSSVVSAAAPVIQSSGGISPTTFSCPRNCDEAIALGLSAEQAGQCSNLDRDGDGVACYGD